VSNEGDNMNKFATLVAVAGFGISVGVAALTNPTVSAADSNCTVKPLGTSNTANQNDSKFTSTHTKVTGKFEVNGKNCKEVVSIVSWESDKDARPLGIQRLYKTTTNTYKEGKHSITVEVPTTSEGKVPSCFYQVDMIKGDRVDMDTKSPGAEHYGNERLLGFVLGGTKNCAEQEKKIKVCNLETKKIITIKESNFDKTKHSRNLDDCKTKVENEFVCDEATGEIIEVTVAEKAKYLSIDDAACDEEVKGEEAPEVIASTGPASVIAGMAGIGGLAGSAQYYFQSRRRLFNR
jgi:hypothetical protein